MAYDQNLIRIGSIGIAFLIVLCFLNYFERQKAENSYIPPPVIDSACEDRYDVLSTYSRTYSKQIDDLNREIRSKDIEIRVLKDSPNRSPECQNVDQLRYEIETLKNDVMECEKSKLNHYHVEEQF